jgi:hypothetical protein
VRVVPIERKGYKLSSTSDGVLTDDIDGKLRKGSTIQKALSYIVNDKIPAALSEAIATPAIVSVETFKAEADGLDFYENRAYGHKGKGRKSGLHPYEWYLKIYTISSVEPIYVGLGNMLEDFKRELVCDLSHILTRQMEDLIREHLLRSHGGYSKRPHRKPEPTQPLRPVLPEPDESYGGNDSDDDDYLVDTDTDTDTGSNDTWCDICDPDNTSGTTKPTGPTCDFCSGEDETYGGNDSDSDDLFNVDSEDTDVDVDDDTLEGSTNPSEDFGLDGDSDIDIDDETLEDFINKLNS